MASIRFLVGCVRMVLSLISLDVVLAYPDGAPTSSCVDMKPDHGEYSSSQSPFDIILSQVSDICFYFYWFSGAKIIC